MAERPSPPDECANCGAAIPRHARACPECGADEGTGWREQSIYDGLDLPESDEESPAPRSRALSFVLAGLTVVLVVIFVWVTVFRR